MRGLVLALILLISSRAEAGSDVGVVVIGEATMQPQLASQLESWLLAHGHQLTASPLPPDAINGMIDCFVLDDEACAGRVVTKRARSKAVVFARVERQPESEDPEHTVMLTAYWFEKGRDAVAERRFCERCTDRTLRSTADSLMAALTGAGRKDIGHLALSSSPGGARVLVDGKAVGVTPLEYDLASGTHKITITHDRRVDEIRDVTIRTGETTTVAVPLRGAPGSSRVLPIAFVTGGAAIVATGVVLFAIDEDVPPGTGVQEEFFRNTAAPGVGMMVVGGLVAGVGGYLLYRSGASSTPVATVTSESAYIGWGGRF